MGMKRWVICVMYLRFQIGFFYECFWRKCMMLTNYLRMVRQKGNVARKTAKKKSIRRTVISHNEMYNEKHGTGIMRKEDFL